MLVRDETALEPPPPGDSLPRVSRTDIGALAEQLSQGGRIESGCVTVIGLDAIRDRLGPRWPRRREQVWDAFERMIERRLPATALYVRLSETDYLVEAGPNEREAQAVSFKLLQEAHLFFLGEKKRDAMRVEAVGGFDGRGLISRPIPPPPEDMVADEPKSFAAPAAAISAAPAPPGRWSALSFVQASHRVQVAFEHQTVLQLATGRASSRRLRPAILVDGRPRTPGAEMTDLLTHAELLAIDAATMAEVLAQGDTPIVAPVFFETVSSTRGRAALLEALSGRAAPQRLLIELVGIDAGTPHYRLLETVSLLAPYCAGVIAQAAPARPCSAVVNGVRLVGLSVDCEDGPRARMAAGAAMADCRMQTDAGRLLFAFGLARPEQLALVKAVGATHASLAARPAVEP